MRFCRTTVLILMVVYLNCTVGVQNPGNNGNVPRRQSNQPRRRSRYNPDGPGGSDDMNKNINSPSKFQQQQQIQRTNKQIFKQILFKSKS